MIHRIVYFSRNLMRGTDAELKAGLEQILASARANNLAAGVTGALIFNSGGFAQVLEGNADRVAEIFERIQRDSRHADVLVLESCQAAERLFPNWSMAYIGRSHASERLFGAMSNESGFDATRFGSTDVFNAMRRLVDEEEIAA